MKKQIVGMLLAGGRVDELSVLTAKRPKSAVPVWGMYRFIDFALSNLSRSGIDVVGVLAQYRPYSLTSHLDGGAPWDYVGRTRELRILSPYQGATDSDWYRGTADAVWQNLNFVRRFSPELVLIASADHIYAMDYRPMIRRHLASGAELTIALTRVPHEVASQFGTATLDGNGRVLSYEEKAAAPASDLASMTVYVFNAATLAERLRENLAEGRTLQIYSEVIPRMVREGASVYGHVFSGYWRYARTLDAIHATNMELLAPDAPDLEAWEVRTNVRTGTPGDPSPTLFRSGAAVAQAMIGPDSVVSGAVEHSVVSAGVTIEAGAIVRDSVIMHGCRIGAGAVLDRVILDKLVTVGPGARIGCGESVPNRAQPASLASGVTVVGKGTAIPGRDRDRPQLRGPPRSRRR